MIEKKDIVIVIPVYKKKLNEFELISLNRVVTVLGEYNIVFVAPMNLKIEYGIAFKKIYIERFDNKYFMGIDGYNALMLTLDFYRRFLKYEYMLIFQLDAFVFSDKLLEFCNMKYDYIGAPWMYNFGRYSYSGRTFKSVVGNGGFSLRRVKACFDVLESNPHILQAWTANEDCFFAYCGMKKIGGFHIADKKTSISFSFERSAEKLWKLNNNALPFGCHQWMKFSRSRYIKMFKLVDVDLTKIKGILESNDADDRKLYIDYLLFNKFIMSKKYDEAILNYGTKISCYGAGNYGELIIAKLLNLGICVKEIFDHDKSGEYYLDIKIKSPKMIKKGNEKIMITVFKHDDEIISELEKIGLVYGVDFWSLKKELLILSAHY